MTKKKKFIECENKDCDFVKAWMEYTLGHLSPEQQQDYLEKISVAMFEYNRLCAQLLDTKKQLEIEFNLPNDYALKTQLVTCCRNKK